MKEALVGLMITFLLLCLFAFGIVVAGAIFSDPVTFMAIIGGVLIGVIIWGVFT